MSKEINPSELSMEDVLDKHDNGAAYGTNECPLVSEKTALAAMKEWASIQNSEILECLKELVDAWESPIEVYVVKMEDGITRANKLINKNNHEINK